MCPKRPSDRAEYSLQQATIVIALVLGGATLFGIGVLRLRAIGFALMPRAVAMVAVASGVAVVAFGVVLALISPSTESSTPLPRASLEPVGTAQALGGAGVSGTVSTPDGVPATGVRISLIPLFEAKEARIHRTVTDENGAFSFDRVHVDPGSPYVAEASYDGAAFPSEVLRAPRGRAHPLRLEVAPTTRSAAALRASSESVAIVGDADGAQAIHAFSIVNRGKDAYTGSLRLPLLPGATAIQEGAGLDRRFLSLANDAMVSSAPILPGTHELTYTYVVQMTHSGIRIDRRPTLPTTRYEVLAGGALSVARTSGLIPERDITLGPRGARKTYRRYVARDLAAGAEIRARVEVARSSSPLRIGAPVAAALAAFAIVLAPLVRRRRTSGATQPAPEPSPTTLGA